MHLLLLVLLSCTCVFCHDIQQISRILHNNPQWEYLQEVHRLKMVKETPAANKTDIQRPVNYDVSLTCRRHRIQIEADRLLGQLYAWQFLDADGTIPPGVSAGGLNWLGSFDVCRSAQKINADNSVVFSGLYCMSYVNFVGAIGLRVGKCLPSSCTDEDAYSIMSDDNVLGLLFNLTSVTCVRDVSFSAADWGCLGLTCFFFLLVLAGTAYNSVLLLKGKGNLDDVSSREITKYALEKKLDEKNKKTEKKYNRRSADFMNNIILSFSAIRTVPQILSSNLKYPELKNLSGFILLSVTYVILYTTTTNISYFSGNFLTAFNTQRQGVSLVVANGTTCWDSLFTISGLLVAYVTLREMDKQNGFPWMKYYIGTLWRVMPVYMLALFWFATLKRHIPVGPYQMDAFSKYDVVPCPDYWWTNLLFVNNFVPGRVERQCMSSSWYIAANMQMFFVSPVIIILLRKKPKLGMILMAALLLMCFVVRGVVAYQYDIQPFIYAPSPNGKVMDHFYMFPYYRIAPYITGLFTGYVLWKKECQFKMKWWVVVLGWVIAAASALALIYGLEPTFRDLGTMGPEINAFYQSINRWVWSLCVAWCLFACVTGNGGPVSVITGWSGFIPFARLSIILYVTHLHITDSYLHSLSQPIAYTPYIAMYMYLGHIFLGCMLAFAVSCVLDTPLQNLGTLVLNCFYPDSDNSAERDFEISKQGIENITFSQL